MKFFDYDKDLKQRIQKCNNTLMQFHKSLQTFNPRKKYMKKHFHQQSLCEFLRFVKFMDEAHVSLKNNDSQFYNNYVKFISEVETILLQVQSLLRGMCSIIDKKKNYNNTSYTHETSPCLKRIPTLQKEFIYHRSKPQQYYQTFEKMRWLLYKTASFDVDIHMKDDSLDIKGGSSQQKSISITKEKPPYNSLSLESILNITFQNVCTFTGYDIKTIKDYTPSDMFVKRTQDSRYIFIMKNDFPFLQMNKVVMNNNITYVCKFGRMDNGYMYSTHLKMLYKHCITLSNKLAKTMQSLCLLQAKQNNYSYNYSHSQNF